MKNILTPARLLLAATLSLPLYAPLLAQAQSAPKVQVWKTPTCGCCEDWVKHMRDNGFEVTTHDVQDTGAVRRNAGMADYGSCHTAVVDGYAIEGHVPASDVRRLLLEKPDAAGLAAPRHAAGLARHGRPRIRRPQDPARCPAGGQARRRQGVPGVSLKHRAGASPGHPPETIHPHPGNGYLLHRSKNAPQ